MEEILSYQQLPSFVQLTDAERQALVKSNSSPAFQDAYAQLGQGILARGNELVQGVLGSNVAGL